MKVYKSKYKNHWISPYMIVEKIVFWKNWEDSSYEEPWVKKANQILEPVCLGIQWIWDKVDRQIDYVKIDYWDTWSMDSTLSNIILPMLKQLQATKHGAPFVDDEDVPEDLRSTVVPKVEEWDTDSNHFLRWDWVLSEMIFAFEHLVDDSWEDQFWTGDYDAAKEVGDSGWQGTRKWDREGQKAVELRINNGLTLFGKYYRNLWD